MSIVARLIVIDPPEPLDVVDHDQIERLCRLLGVSDHLLKRPPTNGARAADGVVHVELQQPQPVFFGVGFDGLLLVGDRLLLPIGGPPDVTNSPVFAPAIRAVPAHGQTS